MTEQLVGPPPTTAPAPSAEGTHRKYRIAWLAASAITAGACIVCFLAPTLAAGGIPNPSILIGAAVAYVVLTALAASVILLYRRVLRGPDVLDMIVAGIVCFILMILFYVVITHVAKP
jgi:preprotein translocase subunit SecY